MPAGETEETWLGKEVERGLHKRFPVGVPESTGSRPTTSSASSARWASLATSSSPPTSCATRQGSGIRVGPGRGCAAGSLVAYALGITELDPIQHKLLFERFLNPERISMPDIDMDFDERRRGDMIRYATEKYGEERVAQIITYGTIKAKQAVKDSARVLGFPASRSPTRSPRSMPPAVMGKDIPLAGIFDPSHTRYGEAGEFRALYEADPDVKKVVDTARGPRGPQAPVGRARRRRHPVREPLLDVIPIHRRDRTARSSPSSTWAPARRSGCSRWTSSACATSPSSTTA